MTVETFNSTTTWLCPAGVTSVQAECWGRGGNGGSQSSTGTSGGGGGGGAYSKANSLAVTPGITYNVGIAVDGTFFSSALFVFAQSGSPGQNIFPTSLGGNGGAASSGVGDVRFSGGKGGNGDGGGGGGGGGSSAGTASNGTNGANAVALSGGAGGVNGAGSGAGGRGGYYTGFGPGPVAGTAPGGGGGGAEGHGPADGTIGALGGTGRVVLTYTATIFRRTINQLGTRAGTRQVHR